jgi:amino acid adenylation domain-containing protein
MTGGGRSLISGFIESLQRYPDRIALELGDENFTYAQLWKRASGIAAALEEHTDSTPPLVALLANRSVTAYAGILGILAAGRGYVPLNPKFPSQRTLAMLKASGCRTVIVGSECANAANSLLQSVDAPISWLVPDQDFPLSRALFPASHIVITGRDMTPSSDALEPRPAPDAVAYLLFTSGSTGSPKGVAVNQANVCSYLDYVRARYAIDKQDRCSQNFDLTFDLSVHDLFACWDAGATLCPFPEQVLVPATTIEDYKLTIWFSVPSVAMFASKLGLLQRGAFPTLRLSLFCGEALSASLAEAWQGAAPSSVLENIYGPTETTIAITHYRWEAKRSSAECLNGIVPIGWSFEGQDCRVVDENLCDVQDGETGELCLSGSQLTKGYLNDPGKTSLQYVRLAGSGEKIWYRTGDLVLQDERKCLYYLGRKDHQVKVNGYRVELQEIDLAIREAGSTELAVAIPWPMSEGTAAGIVAVICGADSSVDDRIIELCAKRLPRYMIPTRIYHFDQLPLNVNGKIDRRQIAEQLRQMNAPAAARAPMNS